MWSHCARARSLKRTYKDFSDRVQRLGKPVWRRGGAEGRSPAGERSEADGGPQRQDPAAARTQNFIEGVIRGIKKAGGGAVNAAPGRSRLLLVFPAAALLRFSSVPIVNNLPHSCRLRGPVAADLHRPRFAHPLETSPPRHPFAGTCFPTAGPLAGIQRQQGCATCLAEGWRGGEVSGGGAERGRWRSAATGPRSPHGNASGTRRERPLSCSLPSGR